MVALTHGRKMALFSSLNLADLTLTSFLLEGVRGHAYEVNSERPFRSLRETEMAG
jgi:hypothetical protein